MRMLVATPGGTARLVWAETNGAPGSGAFAVFNREARLTMNVTDLLQSTSAVIDLFDGDVLERGTYLPSGVRETRTLDEAQEAFPLEPLGFTGKEDDLEVGLMYFGHRYLMPHLGRWASPDPLQIHAGGGGEFGNSYHYVGGNLLQARDPNGLEGPGGFDGEFGAIQEQAREAPTSDTPEGQRAIELGEAAVELETVLVESNSLILLAGTTGHEHQDRAEVAAEQQAQFAELIASGLIIVNDNGTMSVNFDDFRAAVPDGQRGLYSAAASFAREHRDGAAYAPIILDLASVALEVGPAIRSALAAGRALSLAARARLAQEVLTACFVAGTLVATSTGDVPIEEITVGDVVWSIGEDGQAVLSTVAQTFMRTTDSVVTLEIVNERGQVVETLETTSEHPFLTAISNSLEWTPAGLLEPGNPVYSLASGWLHVGSATVQQVSVPVFNFEVEQTHSYFVGEAGIGVHNTCPPGGRGARTVRVRHFTNSRGIRGIQEEQVIRASDQNSVFTERASGRPGSSRDVEKRLGIGRGRGRQIIEFDAQPGEFEIVINSSTGAREMVFRGDVNLEGRNPTFRQNNGR